MFYKFCMLFDCSDVSSPKIILVGVKISVNIIKSQIIKLLDKVNISPRLVKKERGTREYLGTLHRKEVQ